MKVERDSEGKLKHFDPKDPESYYLVTESKEVIRRFVPPDVNAIMKTLQVIDKKRFNPDPIDPSAQIDEETSKATEIFNAIVRQKRSDLVYQVLADDMELTYEWIRHGTKVAPKLIEKYKQKLIEMGEVVDA